MKAKKFFKTIFPEISLTSNHIQAHHDWQHKSLYTYSVGLKHSFEIIYLEFSKKYLDKYDQVWVV